VIAFCHKNHLTLLEDSLIELLAPIVDAGWVEEERVHYLSLLFPGFSLPDVKDVRDLGVIPV
jgi:hypothetical protein